LPWFPNRLPAQELPHGRYDVKLQREQISQSGGADMTIQETFTFGLDLGIGSCGWAVVREGDDGGEIVALGVWLFDVPETDKDRTPTNQLRRLHRGMRRVVRRRLHRGMRRVVILLATIGECWNGEIG
jgi:hypothetical protein